MTWYWRAQILFVTASALVGGWTWWKHHRFLAATVPVTATVETIERNCAFDGDGTSAYAPCTRDQLAGRYRVDGNKTYYIIGSAAVKLDWTDPATGHPYDATVTIDGQDPRFYSAEIGDDWPVRFERAHPDRLAQS
ncbi:hypothetical protein ABDK56_04365 [Sphingomonas sp. ASV193]|uniref:hypothetical protein n=1 Tax=Sphingomonas sp. ASV193 TaxID=3144405 RepID=UPI0032E85CE5